MARRRKYQGGKKSFKKKNPNPGERLRKPMLNLGRLDYFKYDLNEIVDGSDIEDDLSPSFKATVIAKSRNVSIDDAKDYIKDLVAQEKVTKDTSIRIFRLLDRYTRIR
ncbi:MAG: hypothetical protein U9R75_12290 [Candidatus Thermoplasmatota archaeon]|nr:hypothetical protein [Candidatus Thermoplasmatota archaeon]